MNKKLNWLKNLLFIVFFFMGLSIINDLININIDDLMERPVYQKALRGEHSNFLTSEASIRYSVYFIKGAMIAMRIYLLFGMIALFKVFQAFKKHEYFSEEVANSFRKAGKIFVRYCIYIFVFEFIYLFITLDSAPAIELLQRNSIDIIALCGIAFSTLSHVFIEGKTIQEENELTI